MMKYVHEDLNLLRYQQDWGICNADGRRLSEFLAYVSENIPVLEGDWWDFADLIFESENDALEDGYITGAQKNEVILFVSQHSSKYPKAIEYWLSLNKIYYPIVRLIKYGLKKNK